MSPPGPRQRIDITPEDIASVSWKFATGQSHVDAIASTLNSALNGLAGMAGNDSYGHKFASHYDPAVTALFQALSATIRATGQASTALMTTANNYIKADHHSNVRASSGGPPTYSLPTVYQDVTYPEVSTAVGAGDTPVPSFLAKYWPNGHQDKLRTAARDFRNASEALEYLGQGLHRQVQSLIDNNSSASIDAMGKFWGTIWSSNPNGKAPMSAAKTGCDKLAAACDAYANAIDSAHSKFEECAAGAGVAIGLTSAAAILLTPFTFGGSDAGGAALDAGEAAAIFGGVDAIIDESLSTIASETIADLEAFLQAAAEGVPEIEPVEAETSEVSQVLDEELAESRAGGGGGGGGGGGSPPTGGSDAPGPGEPEPWGSDDADVTADRIVNHAPDRSIPGVSEDDLPEYLENIMKEPGYRLRPTPSGTPRMAWWDSDTGTVVIREGNGGTFMQPSGGYAYFLKLIGE